MIQALRNLIDLYTYYFDILDRSFDGLLDLLCVCICQGQYLFHEIIGRPLWLNDITLRRERHACSDRNVMLPAALGEERQETERRTLGACRDRLCSALQDYYSPSAV